MITKGTISEVQFFVCLFVSSFFCLYYIYPQRLTNMYIQLQPKLYTYPKHAFSLSQGPNKLCAAFQSLPTWARTSLIARFLRSSWWKWAQRATSWHCSPSPAWNSQEWGGQRKWDRLSNLQKLGHVQSIPLKVSTAMDFCSVTSTCWSRDTGSLRHRPGDHLQRSWKEQAQGRWEF